LLFCNDSERRLLAAGLQISSKKIFWDREGIEVRMSPL